MNSLYPSTDHLPTKKTHREACLLLEVSFFSAQSPFSSLPGSIPRHQHHEQQCCTFKDPGGQPHSESHSPVSLFFLPCYLFGRKSFMQRFHLDNSGEIITVEKQRELLRHRGWTSAEKCNLKRNGLAH